jgi:hypothetical protein
MDKRRRKRMGTEPSTERQSLRATWALAGARIGKAIEDHARAEGAQMVPKPSNRLPSKEADIAKAMHAL